MLMANISTIGRQQNHPPITRVQPTDLVLFKERYWNSYRSVRTRDEHFVMYFFSKTSPPPARRIRLRLE